MKYLKARWIIGALATLVLLYLLGIRIAHPHDGLKNALGSASSGLVVYQTKPALTVKEKVLVHIPNTRQDPLLAFIAVNRGKTIDVQSGANAFSVDSSQVYGKLILVIPFLGSILNVMGL